MIVHHVRGAVIGIAALVGIVLGVVLSMVYMGYAPMAADSAPSSIEASLAIAATPTMNMNR